MVRCCSCKTMGILVAFVAIFVKVVNPLLDFYLAPPIEVPPRQPYDPDASTDILDYPGFGFLNPGRQVELNLGLTFILRQSFPRWLVSTLEKYEPKVNFTEDYSSHNVSILDARKLSNLTFQDTGFTLLHVDREHVDQVQNWRSQDQLRTFQENALEPQLRKLYPNATKIVFTYSVVRGGNQLGDQPAAINAPHLDYSQNKTARQEFHSIHPPSDHAVEHKILLGTYETEKDEELQVLLGIWKPIIQDNPVCDLPLAILDAQTFSPQQETVHPIHIDFGAFTFHNLNGAIQFHPKQQWYYYSMQTDTEVLVFTQYTPDRHFCNPHGSFINSNCPHDYQSRVSVEMRAAIFGKKQE